MRVPPLVAFLVCTLIWGTTWLAIKVSYDGIDALWAASLRFLIAGVILLILFLARGARRPARRDVAVAAFVGVVLFGAQYGLVYWGEQALPSGLTAVLFATFPFFTGGVAAVLIPTERFTGRHGVGLAVGFLGLILVFRDHLAFDPGALGPMMAIVGAAVAAAISTVTMRKYAKATDPFFLNGLAMLVGSSALFLASRSLGETLALPVGAIPWAATLYLALFGSVVSFVLYFGLLHAWGANRSSLITVLTPIAALVSGLLVSERITLLQWLGSALVVGGVAVSLYGPRLGMIPRAAPAEVREG